MSVDSLKAYETAVAAQSEADRKLKQAKKDLEFHTRKLPRMQEAFDEAAKSVLEARNGLTASAPETAKTPVATPVKK